MSKENYYRLEHVNGDFHVVHEFEAEGIEELIPCLLYFLRGCSWGENTLKEYINDPC